LAISKKRKEELVAQYSEWLTNSRAMILAEYKGMSMKDFDTLRAKVREVGGEFHVVKNTLGHIAFQKAGLELKENFFSESTAIGFAFTDAPAVAKTISDFAKSTPMLTVKGGYLGKTALDTQSVTALAELPPLPVVRAQLLGTLLAPASKLVRTLAEPGRQIAAVIRAYAEPEPEPATA
jgi:large subunit ribosomal protein L10